MENNNINIEIKKPKIFNSVHVNKTEKKKYFRVEKSKRNKFIINNQNSNENNNANNNKFSLLSSIKKDSKKIFSTRKEYSLLNRKTLRNKNLKEQDLLNKNNKNKFFYTTKKESNGVDLSDNINIQNSNFLVRKIIPRKVKYQNYNTYNLFHKLLLNNKENRIDTNNMDINEDKEEAKNDENENNKCYKIKLMLVYLYSIKNLCKYINQNFFNANNKNYTLDGYYYQIYQSLQILDKKINDFKLFRNFKEELQINKENYQDIFSLKDNLLSMKNILNNNMAQNLLNIYVDIDNFCHDYSM